jgi:hypothetical protein
MRLRDALASRVEYLVTTLITEFCQSQPNRMSNQARTPSPAMLGRTWAKNTPIAATAMIVRVVILGLRAATHQ